MSNYLDTRDLHKRLEELEELETTRNDAQEAYENLDPADDSDEAEDIRKALTDAEENFPDYEQEELAELRGMANQISEWHSGEILIYEDDFVEYCQELLEDTGDIPRDLPWYIEIDWDKTAENVKPDYVEVKYQGNTYLCRA